MVKKHFSIKRYRNTGSQVLFNGGRESDVVRLVPFRELWRLQGEVSHIDSDQATPDFTAFSNTKRKPHWDIGMLGVYDNGIILKPPRKRHRKIHFRIRNRV